MNWASASGRAGQGALWGAETEDLNATLVRWEAGKGVAAHTNDEVDVVMTVLEGSGVVRIDDDEQPVEPGMARRTAPGQSAAGRPPGPPGAS